MSKPNTEQYRNTPLSAFPEVLTAEMLAGYLDIGYSKALDFIKYGGISYKKIGNTYRVHKTHFEAWLLDSTSKQINLS
ncbi:excisionase family DNA-binding protein [Oscillospiraceae bacterium PP1C4]